MSLLQKSFNSFAVPVNHPVFCVVDLYAIIHLWKARFSGFQCDNLDPLLGSNPQRQWSYTSRSAEGLEIVHTTIAISHLRYMDHHRVYKTNKQQSWSPNHQLELPNLPDIVYQPTQSPIAKLKQYKQSNKKKHMKPLKLAFPPSSLSLSLTIDLQ